MRAPKKMVTIYLFGGTGDLSRKKLLPALYYLYIKQFLPPFRIIAIARQPLTQEQYWQLLSIDQKTVDARQWQEFLAHIEYISGDSAEDELYQHLQADLKQNHIVGDRMFYLATLPSLYATIAQQLSTHSLVRHDGGWSRLLVEKPFGVDLASSRSLNQKLLTAFPESDIFRIDHFLAKETVQNIVAFRFANGVFEHLWNSQYVDHLQITSAEPMGIEGREKFYNDVGVIRDVIQNHVLSLLAIAVMEEPASFEPKAIQRERLRLLSQIEVLGDVAIKDRVAFGQYTSDTPNPLIDKTVPTAAAVRLSILNPRWGGVPIYIRAGKKMPTRVTELSIIFKEPINHLFGPSATNQPSNILTFRIQPNEGIILFANVKKPGFEFGLERVPMAFSYASSFTDAQLPEAYSKVIYDAIKGDPTLFLDEQGVDASWAAVAPMLELQQDHATLPEPYAPASWGPASFNQLIEKDGRHWIEPDLSVCSL